MYIFVVFSFLILISGLRGHYVGGDLSNYLPLYESISKLKLSDIFVDRTKYGFCFSLFLKLISYVSKQGQFFLLVTSVFNLVFVGLYIRRYSLIPWFSIYIYITMAFYTNTFNSVRASMALAIGLLCVQYIIERRFWKFIICYFIAVEIHQTFMPFILLYYLSNKRLSFKYIIFMISGSFLLSQMGQLRVIDNFVGLYSSLYENIDFSSKGYSLFILLSVVAVLSYWLGRKNMTRNMSVFIHALILAACIQAFASQFALITRITLFFSINMIVLIPNIIQTASFGINRRILIMIICIFCFWYFHRFVMTPVMDIGFGMTNSQGTIPYRFFWE